MEKENTQSQELQKLVETWGAMQRFAFYTGVQRGVLSSMNTLCLRFSGMSFEEYTKAAFKPQLNQMFTTGQAMQLLGGLLSSINELITIAKADAQKDVEKEQQGEKNEENKSGAMA